MNWIEQLNNVEVAITTGDGQVYRPLWKEAKRSRNYNTAAYNFIGVAGTLIDRKLPEGNQYDLSIIFQGDTHLDVAQRFQNSADDPRAWVITHPYWGDITVQPMSLEEDKSVLNNTIFKVKVWETISSIYPIQTQYSNDRVVELAAEVSELAAESLANDIPTIDSQLRTTLLKIMDVINKIAAAGAVIGAKLAKFKQMVAKAKRLISDATQLAVNVFRAVINTINFAVQVVQSVKDRIAILKELKNKLTSILFKKKTKNNVLVYEGVTSGLVALIASSAMTPNTYGETTPEGELITTSDYIMRNDVIEAVDSVRSEYEDYLINLDESQALRSDIVGTFTPSTEINQSLNSCIMEALCNIYDYAFSAKQERVIYLEKDSNPIIQAHRFYGLDILDKTLQFFIDSNSIRNGELIQLRKGRKLLYYV